jgi:hypothetical protein
MACRCATINNSQGGKATTANNPGIGPVAKTGFVIVRLHVLLLAPWIVLAVPSQVFRGLGILLILAIAGVELTGMLARMTTLTTLASVALIGALVAGKVGMDLDGLPSQDTAILMIQFVSIIFFMEATRSLLSFDDETRELGERTDESTQLIISKLEAWVKGQLGRQARLTVGALGLSLFLLVLGGLTSISITQATFSASLVLVVVGVLLFIITQRREPASREHY